MTFSTMSLGPPAPRTRDHDQGDENNTRFALSAQSAMLSMARI